MSSKLILAQCDNINNYVQRALCDSTVLMPAVFFLLSSVHNILNALQYILLPLCNIYIIYSWLYKCLVSYHSSQRIVDLFVCTCLHNMFHSTLAYQLLGLCLLIYHNVINNNDGVIASDMFDIANQSSYTSDTKIDVALDVQPKDFTILSLNCQSLPAKIDNLTVLLETIATDFKVNAICLQETWLSNDSDTSLFELYGYKLISAGKFCSVHSGLMIYLSDEYNFKCLNLHEQSSIWDGLFI